MKKKSYSHVVPDLYIWLKNLKLIGQEDIIVSVTGGDTWTGCFRNLCWLGLQKDELIYAYRP